MIKKITIYNYTNNTLYRGKIFLKNSLHFKGDERREGKEWDGGVVRGTLILS
jgi:hypothetical protein